MVHVPDNNGRLLITFRVRRSRGEMYIGHGRLWVCLCVCLSAQNIQRSSDLTSTTLVCRQFFFSLLTIKLFGKLFLAELYEILPQFLRPA